MTRKRNKPKIASRGEIRRDANRFISNLHGRYKALRTSYRKNLYRLLCECAALAQLAAVSSRIRRGLETSDYWKSKRQKCPKGRYVKLVVDHMLQNKGRSATSRASKYISVIEYLAESGKSGSEMFDAIVDAGGIAKIYAVSIDRGAAEQRQVSLGRAEADQGGNVDNPVASDSGDAHEASSSNTGSRRHFLRVIVEPEVHQRVLSSRVVLVRLKMRPAKGGGKQSQGKEVLGTIKRVIK